MKELKAVCLAGLVVFGFCGRVPKAAAEDNSEVGCEKLNEEDQEPDCTSTGMGEIHHSYRVALGTLRKSFHDADLDGMARADAMFEELKTKAVLSVEEKHKIAALQMSGRRQLDNPQYQEFNKYERKMSEEQSRTGVEASAKGWACFCSLDKLGVLRADFTLADAVAKGPKQGEGQKDYEFRILQAGEFLRFTTEQKKFALGAWLLKMAPKTPTKGWLPNAQKGMTLDEAARESGATLANKQDVINKLVNADAAQWPAKDPGAIPPVVYVPTKKKGEYLAIKTGQPMTVHLDNELAGPPSPQSTAGRWTKNVLGVAQDYSFQARDKGLDLAARCYQKADESVVLKPLYEGCAQSLATNAGTLGTLAGDGRSAKWFRDVTKPIRDQELKLGQEEQLKTARCMQQAEESFWLKPYYQACSAWHATSAGALLTLGGDKEQVRYTAMGVGAATVVLSAGTDLPEVLAAEDVALPQVGGTALESIGDGMTAHDLTTDAPDLVYDPSTETAANVVMDVAPGAKDIKEAKDIETVSDLTLQIGAHALDQAVTSSAKGE